MKRVGVKRCDPGRDTQRKHGDAQGFLLCITAVVVAMEKKGGVKRCDPGRDTQRKHGDAQGFLLCILNHAPTPTFTFTFTPTPTQKPPPLPPPRDPQNTHSVAA